MNKTDFRYLPSVFKKIKKFINNPGVFLRDFLNNKYPDIYNEIKCPEDEEIILLKHDLALDFQIKMDEDVDIVFTWVNDKDPEWQKKYQRYKDENLDNQGQYASDIARFSNHNELYYSVRSVMINMPWVRNIYIITDNQMPKWIKYYNNVQVVDHKDIIPEEYLPTFNSHVIEAFLFNIKGLSERFIYFNDDVFVARPLPVGHFFKGEKITSLFMSKKNLREMSKGNITPTLSASLRISDIFSRDYDVTINNPLVHTYVPLRKSMFEYVWLEYEGEILMFLSNKFRTNSDLNLATFMVPWYTFIKGEAVLARDICYYFNIRSPVARKHYRRLQRVKATEGCPHSFCANDFTATKKTVANYQNELINMLQMYFG